MIKETKEQIINDFKKSEHDTGSVEVQIALLTERINELTRHFKLYPKDFASRRGLLLLVGRRNRFLRYIQRNNSVKYKELLKRLNLRK